MQWYVLVFKYIKKVQKYFLLPFIIFLVGYSTLTHSFLLNPNIPSSNYNYTSHTAQGAVYARQTVLGENGAPVLVEYDLKGNEVKEIGEQTGRYENVRIMSGEQFNGYLRKKEKLERQYFNQFDILSRDEYQWTRFVDQNGNHVEKKVLLPDTLYVWVLKPGFIYPGKNYILLEVPIYHNEDPVSVIPENYIRSLLVSTESGKIIYRTEKNIGYKTGFVEGKSTGINRFFTRSASDVLLNPIPNIKMMAMTGNGDFSSMTNQEGKYRLEFYNPACPGFFHEYSNPIIAELKYSRFHPRKTDYFPYYLIKETISTCIGLTSLGPTDEVYTSQSGYLYQSVDFPVDMLVVRGKGSFFNKLDEKVPLASEQTNLTLFDSTKSLEEKIIPQLDLNNDGRLDTVIPGKIEAVSTLDSKKVFVEVLSVEDAEVLGIFFSPDISGKQPDIIRLPDWAQDLQDKVLLTQIAKEDLENTDLYVVRTSTGELVAEQKGFNPSALSKDVDDSSFNFLVKLRGQLAEIYHPGFNFSIWQVSEGFTTNFQKRIYDQIRPGEQITIYLINRVTGYLGHKTVTLGKNYALIGSSDLSTDVGEIQLYPPNLKLWAIRRPYPSSFNQSEHDQMISNEGMGITNDQLIVVFSEWLDHNDNPLPFALADYGFTGRLARVIAPYQLGPATGGDAHVAHFSIRPGRQTQLVRFPEKVVSRQHFYVQVNATPQYRNPDFSSARISGEMLFGRPEKFVPVKVPIFDEDAARQANAITASERQNYFQWVYRPELQFSLYDLDVQSLQILNITKGKETIRDVLVNPTLIMPGDKLLTWFYSLISPEVEALKSWSKPGELVLAIGDQEVAVTLGKDQKVNIDNLEKVRQLDADGLLTLRLYANNDTQNILWQYNFPGPFLRVPEKVVKGRIKLDVPNERVCTNPARLKFILQQPAKITLTTRDQFSGSGGSETKLLDEVLYPAGTHLYEFDPAAYPNGLFSYQMTGVSEISHKKEQYNGVLEVFYDIDNQLPVGHVVERNIDLFTGNLAFSRTDIDIPGRGGGLQFTRSYNSQSRDAGRLGRGWSHNYDVALYRTGCGYVMVKGMVFIEEGDRYRPGKGYHGTLKKVGNRYDLYTKDGTRYHFRQYAFDQSNRSWHLAYIEDTNGNQTQLSYHEGLGDGRLKSVVDGAGRRLNFFYESRQGDFRITKIKAPGDLEVEFFYDAQTRLVNRIIRSQQTAVEEKYGYQGAVDDPQQMADWVQLHRIQSITDANGHNTRYQAVPYQLQASATENLIMDSAWYNQIDYPDNTQAQFSYNGRARRNNTELTTTVTDNRGNETRYTFNRYGSPLTITSPAGTIEHTWADLDVLLLSRTNENGVKTTYTYDEHGNILTEKVSGKADHPAKVNTYVLLGEGAAEGTIKNRPATQQDREGRLTRFNYDKRGNLLTVTHPDSTTETFTYANNGDRLTATNQRGHTTRFAYDEYGYLASTTDALGGITRQQWNVRGLKLQEQNARTDVLGLTRYRYDGLGRLIRRIDALRNERTYAYDDNGNKLRETDELGRVSEWDYDSLNRVIEQRKTLAGQVLRQQQTYDANGNVLSSTDWLGQTTEYAYDEVNRRILETLPPDSAGERAQTRFAYDKVGNLTLETRPLNRITEYRYDDYDRRVYVGAYLNVGGSERAEQTTTYDEVGNKLSETDPEGRQSFFEYDVMNRLVTQLQPLGRTTRFGYDAAGNPIKTTDALDREITQTFDALNRKITVTDAEGHTTQLAYDAIGNLTQATDALGRVSRTRYDPLNRVTEQIDALQHVTRFSYDAVGNKLTELWPNGRLLSYRYDDFDRLTEQRDNLEGSAPLLQQVFDGNGNLLTATDGRGLVSTYTYDQRNRRLTETLPGNRLTQYQYDALNNLVLRIDPRNQRWQQSFDLLNRVISDTDPLDQQQTYSYDKVGNRLTVTDKRGATTRYSYDALNQLLTTTDPLSQTLQRSYDLVGNVLTDTDKRDIVSAYSYDRNNRRLTTTRANQLLSTLSYDAVGNTLTETDANGNTTAYEYDKLNRVIVVRQPLDAIVRHRYNPMGDRVLTIDPAGRATTWTYDVRRQQLSETLNVTLTSNGNPAPGSGETTTYVYDNVGNRIQQTRPLGNGWRYVYDDANRLQQITDGNDQTTSYAYDANNNLLSQTNALGRATTFAYDELNRRTTVTYPTDSGETARVHRTAYDANNNISQYTDALGQLITYQYDALNRETQREYQQAQLIPSGASVSLTIQQVTTQYDANSNVTGMTETYQVSGGAGGTEQKVIQQVYDDFDRLSQRTDAYGQVVNYQYDANGNRTGLRYIAGGGTTNTPRATSYVYDALNRLARVDNPQGSTRYQYDLSGLLLRTLYPNNASISQSYDGAGRILAMEHRVGDTLVSQFQYQYDANGNRLQQIARNGSTLETTTYTYDALDRLQQVTYPEQQVMYAYDAVYNRIRETTTDAANNQVIKDQGFSYNLRNELLEIKDLPADTVAVSYQYDANGNQIQKQKAGVTTDFVYDIRDHLRQVMQGGSSVGQFLYDTRGLRVEKLGNRGVERYTYDDQSVLAQLDSSNNPIAHYDYGPGRLMALTHRDEGTAFYHFDALGSIVNLTTTTGAVQTRTLYDAWGHHRLQEGDSWNRFGFTGHEEDPETGLVYAKARFYDPDVGRFLSMDAWEGDLTLAPSLHKYLYAYGNPLVWVDPDGKQGYPATAYTAKKEREAQIRKAEEDALYAQLEQDSDHGAFTEESTIGGLPGGYLFYSRSMNAVFGPGGHYIDPMIRSAGKEEYASYVSWEGGYTNKFVKVFTPVAAGLLLSRNAMKSKIITEGGTYSPRKSVGRANTCSIEGPCFNEKGQKLTPLTPNNTSVSGASGTYGKDLGGSIQESFNTDYGSELSRFKRTGLNIGQAPERLRRGFGNIPESVTTTSGVPIHPVPGKTTTILGNYVEDMDNIINKQLNYPKTTDFDAKPGGFNVLNVPDDMYKTPDQFWNEINKPFLDMAIMRGDDILLATKPRADLLRRDDGTLTGFGREIEHLIDNGYRYDSVTGKMVKN
ncbi:RHS repeat-associated core domain-containing protein [Zooshikella ganghwensis]|uniref:RHS repeat-associated core domain-containing protein n=1 Tax=Zooshikella ganghwensis TaxID=202772 RepID=UPI0004178AE5|nr:RHS repeat-associated core domain-containing protein [Zooshikella ganghwensis]